MGFKGQFKAWLVLAIAATVAVIAIFLTSLSSFGSLSPTFGQESSQRIKEQESYAIAPESHPQFPSQVNQLANHLDIQGDQQGDQQFAQRRLHLLTSLAKTDLSELDAWQQRNNISDPHKYLLPAILARFSLKPEEREFEELWNLVGKLNRQQPSLYYFRSIFDICLFFRFRQIMPAALQQIYQKMTEPPQVLSWMDQGTENHMFMQRASGLALLDGSGWQSSYPAVAATNEAWLRAEISKFLTIGQGEFHSSTYTGYTISGLLNLYDFAKTTELKTLAKASLDWLAANMALRYSWGTAGGAESRGYDRGTGDGSGLSAIAWLWWGGIEAPDIPDNYARVALIPALSSYRPPAALRALARKEVPLPFQLQATHPAYYSYHQAQQFGETFYVTPDYSLGTLIVPDRNYQTQGTINAQYATHKLVIRPLSQPIPNLGTLPSNQPYRPDQQSSPRRRNTVITLGGTFHSPLATGASPGDQYLQSQGTVLYQLRLNSKDLAAGVPPASHLVLPLQVPLPRRYGAWYIWQIEGVWLVGRSWGDSSLTQTKQGHYQIWEAQGNNTAWVTEVVSLKEYPTWTDLIAALDKTLVEASLWEQAGRLSYHNLAGELLTMIYNPELGIPQSLIQGRRRSLISSNRVDPNQEEERNSLESDIQDWQILASPYIKESLRRGILSIDIPGYPHQEINLKEILYLDLR